MKKNAITILACLFGLTLGVNAQNSTDKPTLSVSSKTTINTKNATSNKKETPKLASKSKTNTVVKNKTSTPKKEKVNDTPQLGIMNKKEGK